MDQQRRSRLVSERDGARGVPCRRLPAGCNVSRNATSAVVSARAQILAIRGHVAAALNHLANQLIVRQSHGHRVQSRAALSALIVQGVAVVALLHLENQRALPLERGPAVQKLGRNGNRRSTRPSPDSTARFQRGA